MTGGRAQHLPGCPDSFMPHDSQSGLCKAGAEISDISVKPSSLIARLQMQRSPALVMFKKMTRGRL